ncbi:MAG TPA: hypothetical protein VJ350_02715 [Methanoregula sp.]|nr:hypothetical protein [Methanoregula sp.]
MESPYFERGESIILTTDRVSINSAQYDVLLTTRYLILVDVRYSQFQPQKIPLLAILSVKGGKTSTGDLVITLYFSDTSLTGSGQMNLIFSQYPGEQRDRERDEWLKNLMERIVGVRQETIGSKTITPEQGIGIRPVTRHTIAPEMQPPHTTVIDNHPEPVELSIIHDEPVPPAPEEPVEVVSVTDATRPEVTPIEEKSDKIITDTEPQTLPETSESSASLEEPVVPIGDEDVTPPDAMPPEEEQDLITDSEPHTLQERSESPASLEEQVEPIGDKDVTPPDAMPPEEEQDIIIDSEPQTLHEYSESSASLEEQVEPIGSEGVTHPDGILPEEEQDTTIPDTLSSDLLESSEFPTSPEEPAELVRILQATHPEVTPTEDEPEKTSSTYLSAPQEQAIVELTTEREEAEASETIPGERSEPGEPGTQPPADIPPDTPGSPPSPVVFRDLHKAIIIAIVILILGIAGAMVLYPDYLTSPEKGIFPVQNPAIPETTVPAPSTQMTSALTQVVIPQTGVWVRVNYSQNYRGRLGNPGSLREVTGSGDRFYQVGEKNRLVQVQIYKTDNTGNMLTVEMYRNGEIIHRRSTTSPMGVIELLIDAETGNPPGIITPGITQTTPPGSNQTSAAGNQTVPDPGTGTRQVINQSISDTV